MEVLTKSFLYSFPTCTAPDVMFKLEVPIEIPYPGNTKELVQRIINMFHIPVYLEEELNEKLSKFVSDETSKYHNERDEALLKRLKDGLVDVDHIVKTLERAYRDNVVEFAEHKGTSDEEVFAAAYHRLVHSPALETILQVENSYANTVQHTIKNRNNDIDKITKRQTEEMEEKMRLLNSEATEQDINQLATKHFEEQSLIAGRWGSELDAICQTQRTEYRMWLMQTLEEHQTNSELITPSNSPLGTFTPTMEAIPQQLPVNHVVVNHLDESFTIHLGSQLKQMHNVRIVAEHAFKLCRNDSADIGADLSHRLQTALGLYSNELCGLVLLTDSQPSRPSALVQEFINICQSSTDYHFYNIDDQLRRITEEVKLPVEERNERRYRESQISPPYEIKDPVNNGSKKYKDVKNLQTGDVYITKHSNLAEVHVVFHMIVDEASLRSGDINSRHMSILGLRNILKTACCNDITTLSLPVLLTHEFTDEMTVSWCVKRAELVLKCVKGFMIEMASWGGSELKNINFIVPEGISEEVFGALASLLPTIFRVSNPLKFKASPE